MPRWKRQREWDYRNFETFVELMHLTKAQSVTIAVGALALFGIVGVVLVRQNERPRLQTLRALAVPTPSANLGASPFTLHSFERSEIRNGKKIWEVKAAQGQYFPEQSAVVVSQADLTVFMQDGTEVLVHADEATLHLNGASLQKADVKGRVRMVRSDGVVVETEEATYDKTRGTLQAPGKVTLTSAALDVTGVGLSAELEKNNLTLSENVESVVRRVENNGKSGARGAR